MKKTIIKSKRLILKKLDENDAAEVLTYYQKNKWFLGRSYSHGIVK
jgi:ribosomal-protein-alanine N-acetyltransferase